MGKKNVMFLMSYQETQTMSMDKGAVWFKTMDRDHLSTAQLLCFRAMNRAHLSTTIQHHGQFHADQTSNAMYYSD